MAPSIPTARIPLPRHLLGILQLCPPQCGAFAVTRPQGGSLSKAITIYLCDFKRHACLVYFKFPECFQYKNIKTELINCISEPDPHPHSGHGNFFFHLELGKGIVVLLGLFLIILILPSLKG